MCDVSNVIREFRQRLVDCSLQEWHSGMVSRDRVAFYSSLKQSHSLADYLCIIKKLGVSTLKAHRLQYRQITRKLYMPIF